MAHLESLYSSLDELPESLYHAVVGLGESAAAAEASLSVVTWRKFLLKGALPEAHTVKGWPGEGLAVLFRDFFGVGRGSLLEFCEDAPDLVDQLLLSLFNTNMNVLDALEATEEYQRLLQKLEKLEELEEALEEVTKEDAVEEDQQQEQQQPQQQDGDEEADQGPQSPQQQQQQQQSDSLEERLESYGFDEDALEELGLSTDDMTAENMDDILAFVSHQMNQFSQSADEIEAKNARQQFGELRNRWCPQIDNWNAITSVFGKIANVLELFGDGEAPDLIVPRGGGSNCRGPGRSVGGTIPGAAGIAAGSGSGHPIPGRPNAAAERSTAKGMLRTMDGWLEVERLQKKLEACEKLTEVIQMLGRFRQLEKMVEENDKSTSSTSDEKRIIEMFRELRGVVRPAPSDAPEDTRGITLSHDISRMLPSEALLLCCEELEELEMLFHAKRAEGRLVAYKVEGVMPEHIEEEKDVEVERQKKAPEQDKGPIIVVIDTSKSMQNDGAIPEKVAKAITLQCMRIAKQEKRKCMAILFSGSGQFLEHELDVTSKGIASLTQFLLQTFQGGSDPRAAIEHALDRVSNMAGWSNADILLLSDGLLASQGVQPSTISRLEQSHKKHGSRMHAVLIGTDVQRAREVQQYVKAGHGQIYQFEEWQSLLNISHSYHAQESPRPPPPKPQIVHSHG